MSPSWDDGYDDDGDWRPRALARQGKPRRLQRASARLRTERAEMLEEERRQRAEEMRAAGERDRRRDEERRQAEERARQTRAEAELRALHLREAGEDRDPTQVLASASAICAVAGIEPAAVQRLLREAFDQGVDHGTRAAAARIVGKPIELPHPYDTEETAVDACVRGGTHQPRTYVYPNALGVSEFGAACIRCGREVRL